MATFSGDVQNSPGAPLEHGGTLVEELIQAARTASTRSGLSAPG